LFFFEYLSSHTVGDFADLCRFVANESNAVLLHTSLESIATDSEFAPFNLLPASDASTALVLPANESTNVSSSTEKPTEVNGGALPLASGSDSNTNASSATQSNVKNNANKANQQQQQKKGGKQQQAQPQGKTKPGANTSTKGSTLTNHQKHTAQQPASQLPPAPFQVLKQRFHSPRDLDALVEKALQKNLISPQSVERAGESLLHHWLQQQQQFCNGARK
jgi:hypothetical protein